MVSNKAIIVLITVAIILSIVSVAVTISSVNTKMIPDISSYKAKNAVPEQQSAQVGIVVNAPAKNP
jgi:hypothetical protein